MTTTATDLPTGPLTCACGSQRFTVGQLTWGTQGFDAAHDEWGVSSWGEDDYVVSVRCEACEADCTEAAIAAGWWVYHDYPLKRQARREGRVELPPVRVTGRNGLARRAFFRLDAEGHLTLWRGWSNEVYPLLAIDTSHQQTLILLMAGLLELLLDAREHSQGR